MRKLETTHSGYNYKTNLQSRIKMTGFEGYAAVFGVKDLGNDIIERGAFTQSLIERGGRVPLFWNHDPCYTAGTIDVMVEDDYGLLVKGHIDTRLFDTPTDLNGLSIGYQTIEEQKLPGVRLLQVIDLWEVSIVRFPMCPQARFGTVDDVADHRFSKRPRKGKKARVDGPWLRDFPEGV